MANTKERLADVEASLGMVQDELQKMNVDIDDKFRKLETSFQQTIEDTINRMMQRLTNIREEGASATRGRHPNDENQQTFHHGENSNPFAGTQMHNSNRHVKLDFPRFNGGDPTEWLSKAKQYFAYHEVPQDQRVSFASYHLTEEANEWFQAKSRARNFDINRISWEQFEAELWTRFGPLDGEDFDEALCHIRQKGTLLEYQREFERLQNKVDGWSEKALVGAFMGGLNPSISAGIRIFKPKTLMEIINLARLRDDQLQKEKKWSTARSYNTVTPQSTGNSRPSFNPPARPTSSHEPLSQTPRRLSWDELKRKRSLGLCFSCDERYAPRHKCKQPQLFIMESLEDEDETEGLLGAEGEPGSSPEITLHALTGWDSPQTLRIEAEVKNESLVVLIDSGSTHNFICEKRARALNLKQEATPQFTVKVANGTPLQCRSNYVAVPILMGGVVFRVTLYSLPLAGLDIVLGVQWLQTLGPTLCDWQAHTMQFKWASETVTLQGLHHKQIHQIDTEEFLKEAKQSHALFAVTVDDPNASSKSISDDFRILINEFDDLFATPTGLPPQRAIDHHISLKEGTNPINIRPYRYAYYQKDEIERQVEEMQKSGIIRPSSSPFSSPVLLVKKKDGSWRFCTDYRALNNATIKDRFPIPTVEDMLDELHGAAYFTKLDLTAGYHQVRMHPSDVHKTAFRTHNGHYEYIVMPFGLCNAPSTFQALMNDVFRPLLRRSVLVFFDDILIYSASWADHLQHVRDVFQLLRHHKLSVKFKKCDFGQTEVEYLGHVISNAGVKVDRTKIAAMLDWPQPTTKIGALATANPGKPYEWKEGLICYHNRVVLPSNSSLVQQLLKEHHDTKIGGHSGVLRTYKRLARQFYWPSMHRIIREYVAACEVCQRAKYSSLSPAGLLQPLPIPSQVWEDISMDFVDGLPKSAGHTSIMVVVDRLTKFAHLVPLSHPYTASTVAAKFVESIIKLHGIPRSIVSDRDPIFVSLFWKEFWKLAGTSLQMSTAYHPQSDGQTEVVNRCIEQFLRCFVHHKPKQWSEFLPWAEYWYNTSFHISTGTTPFHALYGRAPPSVPPYEIGSALIGELDEQLASRDEMLQDLKFHLDSANNRMKQHVDSKRRDIEFEVGDWVLMKIQPYRQKTLFRRTSQKLCHRFFGPFQIEARIGKVAYRLHLPEGTRIHNVFHVSLLKKWIGETTPVTGTLPPLRDDGVLKLYPERILQQRETLLNKQHIIEVLVQWQGLSSSDSTWENLDQLLTSFPDFNMNLEDKVLFEEGSIDEPQSVQQVNRRSIRTKKPNPRYQD